MGDDEWHVRVVDDRLATRVDGQPPLSTAKCVSPLVAR